MSDQEQGAQTLPGATQAEIDAAMVPPAVYANKIIAFGTAYGLRLAFAEGGPDGRVLSPRAAVILSWQDAQALHGILSKALIDAAGVLSDDKE